MKKLALIIALSILTPFAFAAKKNNSDNDSSSKKSNKSVPRFTANYYNQEGKAELFNGKPVTLYITSAKEASSDKEGYELFNCETYYDKTKGGTAPVYVPEAKAKFFLKTFGQVKSSAVAISSSSKNNKNNNNSNSKNSSGSGTATRNLKVKLIGDEGSVYYMTE